MARDVRYVTTADDVRIAYSVQGEGTPIIWVPGWISHLDFDSAFFPAMKVDPADHGVLWISMDKRGSGLSSRNISDYSIESRVSDVIGVADDLGLEQFALGGMSEGGPIALATAATHTDRITKLVVHGSFAAGECIGGSADMREALRAIVKAEWGIASRVISDLFTSPESVMNGEQFAEYQKISANHDDARKILDAAMEIDVRPLLSQITAPTLVVHHRDDRIIPIENGQEIAAGIKGARFLSFPGTHIAAAHDFRDAFTAILDFVGSAADGRRTQPVGKDSAFKTILFTDLVAHTEMMSRLGDEDGRAVLREHETITRDVLKQHGGTEVKTMGDGFMASFGSVTKAVECAVGLQRAIDARNQQTGDPANLLGVRVGLNAGEPIEEDGDLFGATVILASRIAARAGAGEILVSDNVRSLCAGKGFLFADLGDFVAKGFEEPVRVYEVRWNE